jgi:hypothetical protein
VRLELSILALIPGLNRTGIVGGPIR